MLAVLATALLPAGAWADTHGGTMRDGSQRAYAAIVGGHYAKIGQFPWVVRIVVHLGRVLDGCSGTVVAANLILTAGHCVEDVRTGVAPRATAFEVKTAAQAPGQPTGGSYRVSRVLVYPGFERQSGVGDAALLELSTSAAVPSIRLASEPADWRAGTRALMAGWGHAGGATPSAALLRWARTVVQSPQSCAARLRGFYARRELCAMNAPSRNTAGCAGDSGGPLLVQRGGEPVEIGVLNGSVVRRSRTITCLTTEPTVYARSSLLSGWVHAWIQRLDYVPVAVTEGAPTAPPR